MNQKRILVAIVKIIKYPKQEKLEFGSNVL